MGKGTPADKKKFSDKQIAAQRNFAEQAKSRKGKIGGQTHRVATGKRPRKGR